MQHTITETDLLDFLDRLQLFVPNLGTYEYHSSNEHFHYLIKTSNHSIVVSMEQLIANQQKQLTQEDFRAIAAKLNEKEKTSESVQPAKTHKPVPSNSGNNTTKVVVFSLVGVIVLIAGMGIYGEFKRKTSYGSDYDWNDPVEVFEDPEITNPEDFLEVDGTWRFNWLRELKVEGTIANSATKTTYKDVTITIQGKAKTGTVLEERKYTIHEFVPANSSIPFDLHTSDTWDNDVVSVGIEATEAVVE